MAILEQIKKQQGDQPKMGADAVMEAVSQPSNVNFTTAGSGGKATEEENKIYEKALAAMGKLIYGAKDSMSDKVADSIVEENKPGSIIQTGLMLLNKVDETVNIDPVVIPQLIQDTVQMLTDVAEQKNDIQFSDDDVESAAMGMFEAILSMVGGDQNMEGDFNELTEGMSEQELVQMKQLYQQKLQAAKPQNMQQPEGQPMPGNQQQPMPGNQQPMPGGQVNG